MNYALNRQRISQTVLQSLCGDPISLPWPQQSPAYEQTKNATYSFRPRKSRGTAEAGGCLRRQSRDHLQHQVASARNSPAWRRSTRRILQSLGLTGDAQARGRTDVHTDRASNIPIRDCASARARARNFEASTMLQSTSAYNYAGNFAGFKDDTYAQLVQSATTEPDPAKRKQVYCAVERLPARPELYVRFFLVSAIALVSSKVHALDFSGSAALTTRMPGWSSVLPALSA